MHQEKEPPRHSRERRVILFRHGFSQGNHLGLLHQASDSKLTDLGRTQSVLLGEFLKNEGVQCIYTSGAERTLETAALVGAPLGLVPHRLDILRELRTPQSVKRIMWGGDESRLPDSMLPEFMENRTLASRPQHQLDDGESLVELENRAADCLLFFQEQSHRVIAACSHGGMIRTIVAYVNWCLMTGGAGLDIKAFRMMYQQPLDNAGLVVLSFEKNPITGIVQWHMESWNERSYLGALRVTARTARH
jgi:broad specificity phosphatase PhoE